METQEEAIKAWYDAETDEQRAAAVAKFPELSEIFSIAQAIKTKN